METDVIDMLERMAQTGTAPDEGCSSFSVGFDDAVDRLRQTYIGSGFRRGASAQKFIIGPYGSGKTHFLRHVLEVAREDDCVTSEVALNKDIDFTKTAIVYREICRRLRAPGPGPRRRGLRALLETVVARIRADAVDEADQDTLLDLWVRGLSDVDLEAREYLAVLQEAIEDLAFDASARADLRIRWLEGDWSDTRLARECGAPVVGKDQENLFARRAMLSLFQFIRHAGFAGTVLAYDEAEQGLTTEKKKMNRILSMLQTEINAVADLRLGSALIMFALTPDVIDHMATFAALQQRIADPAANRTFFDGNTRAVRIDLRHNDAEEDLRKIAKRLAQLFLDECGEELMIDPESTVREVDKIAEEVLLTEPGSGSRRAVVKRVAQHLLEVYDADAYRGLSMMDQDHEPEV